MRLCYGTLASLVLKCCVNSDSVQGELHKQLIYALTDKPFQTVVSDQDATRMFKCKRQIQIYIKKEIRDADNAAIVENFKRNILPMLDQNKRKALLLSAAAIVNRDDIIKEDTVINRIKGTTKAELAAQTDFDLAEALAGLFIYAALELNNKEGADSLCEITNKFIISFEDKCSEIKLVDTPGTTLAIELVGKKVELAPIAQSNDLLLLSEANRYCPMCNKPLLVTKNNEVIAHYRPTYIYPLNMSKRKQEEFDQIASLTDDPYSIENQIALCEECSSNYTTNTSFGEYQRLVRIKGGFLRQGEQGNKISKLPLDEQIEYVIRSIVEPKEKTTSLPKFKVTEIKNKIRKENFLLERKIRGYIVEHFNYVKTVFTQLNDENKLRFEKVQAQVSGAYYELSYSGNLFEQLSQEDVFNTLVEWLMKATRTGARTPCEIVIAFFIQNCEVFDEIAE